jgi:hypothetical protein
VRFLGFVIGIFGILAGLETIFCGSTGEELPYMGRPNAAGHTACRLA